jgi:7-cyano-7-deazaguanine tRNA-ribosyltransferase
MSVECFETKEKDLLGRIGILHTKSGRLETPYLFPVVNPNIQPIPPKEIKKLGFPGVITNSYIIWKKTVAGMVPGDVHRLLNFDGIIATDSGAYQILQYGDVEVPPVEIVGFQEKLNTDIGVILDVPTGANPDRKVAFHSVLETIRRADGAMEALSRADILWEGPIQGGVHLDLVRRSAREMSRRPFSIYALGSPTPSMEQYSFDYLVDMVAAARIFIPMNRPLHLFGAGHPIMLSLAAALGCDLFDSAAYAIFARAGRYLTNQGTFKIRDLSYFPCACPECTATDPDSVRKLGRGDQEIFLARHNLHVSRQEVETVKQAIADGRLWELVSARSRSHPALRDAFTRFVRLSDHFEQHTPATKKRGLFVSGALDLFRPEIVRYNKRLIERRRKKSRVKVLLLVPQNVPKRRIRSLRKLITFAEHNRSIDVCYYGGPYDLIPSELTESFPLAQTESADVISTASSRTVVLKSFLRINSYRKVMLVKDGGRADEAHLLLKRLSRSHRFKLIAVEMKRARSLLRALKQL